MQTATKPAQPAATLDDAPVIIDTEKGTKSVAGFARRGQIKIVPAHSFKEVENAVWAIEGAKTKPRGIVLDTITGLVGVAILNVVRETPRNQIWENRSMMQATKQHWGQMGGIVVRLLNVARSCGIPFIITAHEGEREDEVAGTTRHFPDLNKFVRSDVVNNADMVARVYRSSSLFEADGKRYPAGSLAVRIMPTEQYYAKIRVPDDAPVPPAVLGNDSKTDWKPVVERLFALTEGFETAVLYGEPGVGKTRLATELITHNK